MRSTAADLEIVQRCGRKRSCSDAEQQQDKRSRLGQDKRATTSSQQTAGQEPRQAASTSAHAQHDTHVSSLWLAQEEAMYPSAAQLWQQQNEVTPNMRHVLLRWLLDVCRRHRLARETFLLAVNYLDRYLVCKRVTRKHFQLLGIACLWVAGKYEEVRTPTAQLLLHASGNAFTVKQLCAMEGQLLAALRYEMGPPSALKFLDWLLTEPPTAATPASPTATAAAAGPCSGPAAMCCDTDHERKYLQEGNAPVRHLATRLLDVAVLAMHFGPAAAEPHPAAPAPVAAPLAATPVCQAPQHKGSCTAPATASAAVPSGPMMTRRRAMMAPPPVELPCSSLSPGDCSGDDVATPLQAPQPRARPAPPSTCPSAASCSSPASLCSAATAMAAPSTPSPTPGSAPSHCIKPPAPSIAAQGAHASTRQGGAAADAGVGAMQQPASVVAASCLLAAQSMHQRVSRARVASMAARIGCDPARLLRVAQIVCELAAAAKA